MCFSAWSSGVREGRHEKALAAERERLEQLVAAERERVREMQSREQTHAATNSGMCFTAWTTSPTMLSMIGSCSWSKLEQMN